MAESVKLQEGYFHYWSMDRQKPHLVRGYMSKDEFWLEFYISDGGVCPVPLSDLQQGETLVPVTVVETARWHTVTEANKELGDHARGLEEQLAEGVHYVEGLSTIVERLEKRIEEGDRQLAAALRQVAKLTRE